MENFEISGENELENKLQFYKDMLDSSYDTTKNKYNSEFANRAMLEYFLRYRVNSLYL